VLWLRGLTALLLLWAFCLKHFLRALWAAAQQYLHILKVTFTPLEISHQITSRWVLSKKRYTAGMHALGN
jgi:hypothetical protein